MRWLGIWISRARGYSASRCGKCGLLTGDLYLFCFGLSVRCIHCHPVLGMED